MKNSIHLRYSIKYLSIIIGFIILSACSPQPSESMIETAIAETGTAIAQLTPSNPPSPTPEPTNTLSLVSGCVKGANSLNIRIGPSTESEPVGYLLEGDCAIILGRNSDNTWVKINQGWVSSFFLTMDSDIGLLPVVSVGSNPTPTMLVQDITETITTTQSSSLVISGSPKDYLLQPEDIPDPYYLPGSDWIGPYSNEKIIEVRGVEDGQAYIDATGRIEGWFVWYQLGDNTRNAPEKIGCYIVFYKTGEGARLAIGPQWHPVYKEADEGKAELVDLEIDLGQSHIGYIYREQTPNQDFILDYNIEFTYRNALTVITGHGVEMRVRQAYLLDLANIVLQKLRTAQLINPY